MCSWDLLWRRLIFHFLGPSVPFWHLMVIVLASAPIGLTHRYQGVYGIVTIALKSVVMSRYFYRYRRLLPLVISHGLYDGLQFLFVVNQFR